ncbi:MAG: hypothetical protein KDB00_08770 [Planctomycetales bacterium]|nr:hypothetical protein [Planctomycetales bacterium]
MFRGEESLEPLRSGKHHETVANVIGNVNHAMAPSVCWSDDDHLYTPWGNGTQFSLTLTGHKENDSWNTVRVRFKLK